MKLLSDQKFVIDWKQENIKHLTTYTIWLIIKLLILTFNWLMKLGAVGCHQITHSALFKLPLGFDCHLSENAK